MSLINIRGNVLDPDRSEGTDGPSDTLKTEYAIVQTESAMKQATVKALRKAEATILKRMDGNNWLVRCQPQNLEDLRTVPGVQHVLPYDPMFVLPPSLKDVPTNEVANSSVPLVAVVLHDDARESSEHVLEKINEIADAEVTMSQDGVINVQLNSLDDLKTLASLESVQAIETVTAVAPTNDRAMEIVGINQVNRQLVESHLQTLTGEGQVIAIADTGVDTDHIAFAFKDKIFGKWHTEARTDSNDNLGHGTHVAGTVLGGPVRNWQDQEITGMAPGAQLLVQAVNFTKDAPWSSEQLFDYAYGSQGGNCRIHNNSWGTPIKKGSYDQLQYTITDAEKVDRWAFNNPDFLIVRSAGNDGNRYTKTKAQIGSYAVSKNVLTVGATFTDRPLNDSEIVDYNIAQTEGYKSMKGRVASFSSRGPVLNTKRTKPDLVAPGAVILSCRTSSTQAQVVNEQKDWVKKYGRVPGSKPDDKLIFCSGTSMSTPVVSGQAALLREALLKWKNISNPSAPHMKALLINGTDDLGEPSTAQGFGQINFDKVLEPVRRPDDAINAGTSAAGHAEGVMTEDDSDEDTESRTWRTTAPKLRCDGAKINLQLTLVYHDAPGELVQNRINLFVQRGSERTESSMDQDHENVHRILLRDLTPGEVVTIGIEPVLIAVGNVPWGLAWNHFEV